MKVFLKIFFIALFIVVVKNVTIKGEQKTSILLNGKTAEVKTGDMIAKADYQFFNIEGAGDFILSSTWSFFSLNSGQEYNLRHWHAEANCGCWKQACGKDCATGAECFSAHQAEEPLMCLPWTKRKGFCASLVAISETQNYTAYHINHISTIALTTYGGPQFATLMPGVTPGFTIRSKHENQKYAFNAMIVDSTPRKQEALSQYRYAESEGRVITLAEFNQLDAKPNMTVNFQDATCPKDGNPNITTSIYKETINAVDKNNFRTYSIVRKASIPKMQNLFYQDILTPVGVQEWNGTETVNFLDPCNQLFLTLQRDKTGNFFVNVPPSQRLITGDIICVAINDNPATQYDLVLYELKNGTTTWTQSDRFVGLLSRDYLDTLQVRVATQFTPELAPTTASVHVEFTTELDPPVMRLTTNDTLRCEVYVSPTCVFPLETTGALYATKQLQSCGLWYEVGGYNCEGILGIFYPPAKFVRAPLYGWSENTAMQPLTLRAVHALNPPDNKTPGGFGLGYLKEMNRSNWFDKIMTIILYLGVLSLLAYAGYKIYNLIHEKKNRKHTRLPTENPDSLKRRKGTTKMSKSVPTKMPMKQHNKVVYEELFFKP
jgi:hypothetical protein